MKKSWHSDIINALENRDGSKVVGSESAMDKYDSEFFKSHLKYRPIYDFIGDLIAAHFKPSSAIDYGCGCGFLLERLWGHGIKNILGVEGSAEVEDFWNNELPKELTRNLIVRDILSISCVAVYDIVICMEVAEHIDEKQADKLVSTVSMSSDKWVWWTAAQPGQGGTGHINCQSVCYWVEKFKKFGFEADWEKTYEIKQAMLQNHAICLGYPWFKSNLCIFKKIGEI